MTILDSTVDFETDPLNVTSPPDVRWTTANTGEQMPGVLSPLTITLTAEPAELGFRECFRYLGVIPESEVRVPAHRHDFCLGFFNGRCAANVGLIRRMFDLTPGTSGAAYEAQMFGGEGLGESERLSRMRYPIVAVRMPLGLLRVPHALRSLRAELQAWWTRQVLAIPMAGLDEARAACLDAERQMNRNMPFVWIATLAAQLAYGRLCTIVARSGNAGLETTVCGGYGTEELEMATDFWALSRDRITKAQFLGRHGWTVPLGMELAEESWRELPEALDPLLESYKTLSDDKDPTRVAGARAAQRRRAERKILAGLPVWRWPDTLLVLRMASEYMQLRTVQKACNAITWDVMRAGARRLGTLLHEQGKLDDPDDVFQLTAKELLGPSLPTNARELVVERRALHREYLGYRLPTFWTGQPTPEPIEESESSPVPTDNGRIEGIGVSPGIVEGPVRVVSGPTDGDVKAGEILVCETTDPSWISLMVVASGLVIDVGGPVSHGAIVARELGVPCVINTHVGTSRLRTGQHVRVDGSTGVVEMIGAPVG
jgi:phosphohistidine swiveling domain-containing protein